MLSSPHRFSIFSPRAIRRAALCCIAIPFWLVPPPLGAQSARAIGMVQRIDARSSPQAQVILVRRGEEKPLVLGQYVYDGDRIRVPNADASVTVSRPRGPLSICAPGSASWQCNVVLDSSGGMLEAVQDFSSSLLKLVSWYSSTASVNVTTRSSDPPAFSIGAGRPQTIQSGTRNLWIEWSGGKPPFVIKVAQERHDLKKVQSTEREVQLSEVAIKAGTLEISVIDAEGRTAKLPLTTVRELPQQRDILKMAPDETSGKYVYAVWLSAQSNGSFLYESALQLSSISNAFPAAEALRRGLAAGERPRP